MKENFNLAQVKNENADDESTLSQIQKLLELHGYETQDLIHQYYIERHTEQQNKKDKDLGQLTVKCSFRDNSLEVSFCILLFMLLHLNVKNPFRLTSLVHET